MKSNRYILAFARLGRTLVTGFISVAFLWLLALSASPQLHQWLHPDAHRVEHSCPVTMIDPGGCNHVSHPVLVCLLRPTIQLAEVPVLTSQWVESPFLGARIFEHAPPCG